MTDSALSTSIQEGIRVGIVDRRHDPKIVRQNRVIAPAFRSPATTQMSRCSERAARIISFTKGTLAEALVTNTAEWSLIVIAQATVQDGIVWKPVDPNMISQTAFQDESVLFQNP
jgi:hypothetical protein